MAFISVLRLLDPPLIDTHKQFADGTWLGWPTFSIKLHQHALAEELVHWRASENLPPIRLIALLVATVLGLYVCFLLLQPFIAALTWALTIAVLTTPAHHTLESRLGYPNLAAATSVILLVLLVILPLYWVAQQVLEELSNGLALVQEQVASGQFRQALKSSPWLERVASTIEQRADLASILSSATTWLTNLGTSVVRESLSHLLTVVLTFYLLFYFLRDRREVLRHARLLSPLTDAETDRLFAKVSDTIHGVIFGTVITAGVQGVLGGLAFWLLGLANPILWGLVMGLLAIVPILGAFLVWVPAAVYLALSGEWGKAALLTAWGGIVVGGMDNILHPVLAGGRLHMHTIPTFIAIVGGLMLFGPSGLILGPLALALTIALLEVWRARIQCGEDVKHPS
jgi:predicted PurR-regulated permease PerM